jgi:hypothetical protein
LALLGLAAPGLLPDFVEELVSALRKSPEHAIVGHGWGGPGPGREYVHWSQVLQDDEVQAVVCCRPLPPVIEVARELAARGAMLVIPASSDWPQDVIAELTLYDAEGAATLIPVLSARTRPELHALCRAVQDGQLGRVISVESHHEVPDGDVLLADRRSLADLLLREIDLLRMLGVAGGGEYTQVTLMRQGERAGRLVSQSLQLAGVETPDATSLLRTVRAGGRWQVRVTGGRGEAGLETTGLGSKLTVAGQPIAVPQEGASFILDQIDRACRRDAGAPQWVDVSRAFELWSAAERSLVRRRTIEVPLAPTSERSQFKTQMAALGCGVLVYTFVASLLLLLAGAVLDPRDARHRQAAAARLVLTDMAFDPVTHHLTPAGEAEARSMAPRLDAAGAVVMVEASTADEQRLAEVQRVLSAAGVSRVSERTIARPLSGRGFEWMMQLGRWIAFLPLGVFLLLQLLMLLTRRPTTATSRPATSALAVERPPSRMDARSPATSPPRSSDSG